jgi:sensor histidine kinase YesM
LGLIESVKSFILTFIFNTIIALVLFIMVLDEPSFLDVFIISQLTGLSICFFIMLAVHIGEKRGKKWNTADIIAGLLSGILSAAILSWIYIFFGQGIEPVNYFKDIFMYVFVFGIVFGVPISYFFSSRQKIIESEKLIQQEKIKRLIIEKESAMTSLRLLQAQIEPHFLFNTLSNVIALFDIDIDKARQMIINMNDYFRICLQRTRREMITLDEELDLVKQYLEIFKIRMGRRLSYKINNHIQNLDIPFPPFIIQPLVENSIKYGIEPELDGGTITIDCRAEGSFLIIIILDTGAGFDIQSDENISKAGIGINNVSLRLENIYNGNAELELKQNYPKGIKAIIKVPL